jgi:hypothetical protein
MSGNRMERDGARDSTREVEGTGEQVNRWEQGGTEETAGSRVEHEGTGENTRESRAQGPSLMTPSRLAVAADAIRQARLCAILCWHLSILLLARRVRVASTKAIAGV